MKNLSIVIGCIVIVLVLGGLIFIFLPKNSSPATSTSVQFPNGSSTTGSGTNSGTIGGSSGSTSVKTITVAAPAGGTPTTVNDFINNGTTVPDPSNAGTYYLTPFSSTEFAISYTSSNQFFTIALEQEPIGQARLDAQAYLAKSLGISQQQLCNLNYYLGTDDQTNDTYAGKNLGFSVCQGATALPN